MASSRAFTQRFDLLTSPETDPATGTTWLLRTRTEFPSGDHFNLGSSTPRTMARATSSATFRASCIVQGGVHMSPWNHPPGAAAFRPLVYCQYHFGSLSGVCMPFLLRLKVRLRTEKRSEEHTSEVPSRPHLVCRLLLDR